MAGRRRKTSGGQAWWTVFVLVLAAAAALWWFAARRGLEPAPSASLPGASVLKEAPPREDLTNQDKDALDQVLRERGAGQPNAN